MSSLSFKIRRRLKMTWTSFCSDCHFSLLYASLRILDELGGRIGFHKLSKWAHTRKDQWILSYLRQKFHSIYKNLATDSNLGTKSQNAPIWVCWWTGVETAPPLVQKCVQSIYQNSGEHPVHIIDQSTIAQYLDIPDYMMKKVQKKKMGLAHLADYIRVSLLEKYGGLWLDATIFCSKTIPEWYFESPVFTCKSHPQECGYLSKMQWVTFILGGWKGNIFYRYLKSAFELYWSQENSAIDYLFFDHLIFLGREEIPVIKKLMDDIPVNNLHRDDLQAAMNAALPAEEFSSVLSDDTVLYKLSWRETYSETTKDGQKSIFLHFISNL